MPSWINTGRNAADAYQAFQKALLNQPEMKRALAIHIRNLDLQRQINKNPEMTEERAFQIIRFEIQKFERTMQTSIKQAFPPSIVNQEDLNNPLNMQSALNNPNSYASMQMDSMTGTLLESLNTEASNIEQAQQVESENLNQQIQQQQIAPGYESDSEEDDEKIADRSFEYAAVGEAAKEAIEAFARGDEKGEVEAVANITEKVTGKKVDLGDFLKDEKKTEKEEESRVFANVPKPPRDIET